MRLQRGRAPKKNRLLRARLNNRVVASYNLSRALRFSLEGIVRYYSHRGGRSRGKGWLLSVLFVDWLKRPLTRATEIVQLRSGLLVASENLFRMLFDSTEWILLCEMQRNGIFGSENCR